MKFSNDFAVIASKLLNRKIIHIDHVDVVYENRKTSRILIVEQLGIELKY